MSVSSLEIIKGKNSLAQQLSVVVIYAKPLKNCVLLQIYLNNFDPCKKRVYIVRGKFVANMDLIYWSVYSSSRWEWEGFKGVNGGVSTLI